MMENLLHIPREPRGKNTTKPTTSSASSYYSQRTHQRGTSSPRDAYIRPRFGLLPVVLASVLFPMATRRIRPLTGTTTRV